MMVLRYSIKILASLFIAQMLVTLGNVDVLEYMQTRYYWIDIAITSFDAFILIELVDRTTGYLNNKFRWREGVKQRLWRQVFFGFLIPAVLIILITVIQDTFVYNQPTLRADWFREEYVVSLLFLVIANFIFLTVYFFNNMLSPAETETTVLGKKAGKIFPVQVQDIAAIILRNEVIFLKKFDGTEVMLSENLDHYENLLPGNEFFRTNRQTIIHKKNCRSFKPIENGKIEVILQGDDAGSLIVSQKKAASFRSWIKS